MGQIMDTCLDMSARELRFCPMPPNVFIMRFIQTAY
jgi:hypothetical protein